MTADEVPDSQPSSNEEDWLASLRSETAGGSPEDIPGDSSNQENSPTDADSSEPEEDVPEWLKRIRMREQAEREASQQSSEEAAEQGGDWLEDIRKKQGTDNPTDSSEEQAEPELPDWIAELRSKTPEESGNEEIPGGEPKAGESSDSEWLKKLSSWQSTPEEVEKKEETQPAVEPTAGIPADKEIPPAEPEEGMPDWLSSFLGESAAVTPEIGEKPPEAPVSEEQLADVAESEKQLTEAAGTSDETEPFSEHLAKTLHEQPEEAAPEESLISEEGETTPANEISPADEGYDFSGEEQPASAESSEPVVPPVAESTAPISEEEPAQISASEADLDWLHDYHEAFEEEGITKAGEAESAATIGMSEKSLTGAKGSTVEKPVQPVIAEAGMEAGEQIEMAKLPPWLQKLRSVDNIQLTPAAEPVEAKPETAGPLAGIEGALQSAEVAGLYTRPPIYTSKVQITERQSMHADILRSMVEKKPYQADKDAVAGKPKFNIIRVLVGFVLILAIALPLILQPGVALLPSIYPPETANTFNLVNAIPVDQPVLLAADFEPGLSGEMSLSAQMLVEHLMLRNLPLVVLSTNPTGSALMETVMNNAQINAGAYDRANRVVSLGYLAGGSVGLQTLARDLKIAVPFTSDLTSAWELPVLQNIQSISDFGAVIVITEDADTARYWVEQVQPALGSTPLIVVSSAQAAPMLQPYYDSGQISGMISGLSGATAYEQILQRPGSAVNAFGAYQIALLILVLILFIGGAVSIIRNSTQINRA